MTAPAEGGSAAGGGGLRRLAASPYLLLVLAMLFWAGNAVVGRAAADSVPPIALAFWRWIIASLIIVPFAGRHLWAGRAIILRDWRILTGLALISVAAPQALVYMGLAWTTATNAALFQTPGPVIIPVVAWMIYRTRLSGRQAAGLVAAVAGVSVVVFQGDPGAMRELAVNDGDLLLLVATLCWAIYSVLLRRQPAGLHPLAFAAATFVIGLLFLTPVYVWDLARGTRLALTAGNALAIAYVGVFPSVLAFLFWNRGVASVGANTAGLFLNLIPVFGVLMAVAFLGEAVHLYHLAGIALIVAGIHIATRRRRR